MTTAIVTRTSGLPSIERAKAVLDQAKIPAEVRKIKILAQAVATLERGKEIGIDAGEIVLLADARIGELTRAMAPMPPAKSGAIARGKGSPAGRLPSKGEQLYAEGISKQLASECEKVAALSDSGALGKYIASCRAEKRAPTLKGAISLTKAKTPVKVAHQPAEDGDDECSGPDEGLNKLRKIEDRLQLEAVAYVRSGGTLGMFIDSLEYVVAILKQGAAE